MYPVDHVHISRAAGISHLATDGNSYLLSKHPDDSLIEVLDSVPDGINENIFLEERCVCILMEKLCLNA